MPIVAAPEALPRLGRPHDPSASRASVDDEIRVFRQDAMDGRAEKCVQPSGEGLIDLRIAHLAIPLQEVSAAIMVGRRSELLSRPSGSFDSLLEASIVPRCDERRTGAGRAIRDDRQELSRKGSRWHIRQTESGRVA
jgi:hypothetical protein